VPKFRGLILLAIAACARMPRPVTATQLAERSTGRTLSTYLGQRDASAAVCDLNARGPHLAVVDADVRQGLMDGLRSGRIDPALWRQCAARLIRSTDAESGAVLLDAVARSYRETILNTRIERDQVTRQQLSALQTVLVDEAVDVRPHPRAAADLLQALRAAQQKKRLGPIAQQYATAMIADVETSEGLRGGRPVDIAELDELLRARDDSALRRYASRLPDSSLRSEARHRVIRLRIEESPREAVHANAAAIEERLMRLGVNPIAIAEHAVLRGTLDESLLARRVVVRQDLDRQTAILVGAVDDEDSVSVLPQVILKGALHLDLDGVDGAVTLCDSPEALDPDPCVPASAVTLDSRLAYLERDGTLRFVDHLTSREALTVAASGDRLVVPVMVSGQRVATIEWELRFETPNELVFGGGGLGSPGPDLRLRLEVLTGGRLSYVVSRGSRQYIAIVERNHAKDFDVISRGGAGERGRDGSSGHDGQSGLPGTSASCPSFAAGNGARGDDGGAGGDGEAGGSGGNGGDVVVDIAARGAAADELVALLRRTVTSRGGAGGPGGSGGKGGRGGAGGSGGAGTTCVDTDGKTTFLPAGQQGFSGTDGRSGFDGLSGSAGRDGRVTVHVQ
jgi:hypothetical protein